MVSRLKKINQARKPGKVQEEIRSIATVFVTIGSAVGSLLVKDVCGERMITEMFAESQVAFEDSAIGVIRKWNERIKVTF